MVAQPPKRHVERQAKAAPAEREAARLLALRRTALLDTPPEEEFDRLTRLAADVLRAPLALLTLLDADRLFFKSQVGLPEPLASGREVPLPHAPAPEVSAGVTLAIAETGMDPLAAGNPVAAALGIAASLGAALVTTGGQVLGSLSVGDHQPRDWSEADARILDALAGVAVKEMERRTLAGTAAALAAVLDRLPDGGVGDDETGCLVLVNAAAARIHGTAQMTVPGAPIESDGADQHRRDREKDDFLASVSHDLKNPLTVIKGTAQMLQMQHARTGEVSGQQLVNASAVIQRAVARMVGQLDEVFDVARAHMGSPRQLHLERVDLVALAREAIADYTTAGASCLVHLGASEDSLVGWWDVARLQRVIANLLSNAVKYSPNAGDVSVAVRRVDEGAISWAELSVADHGIGIPAADIAHVFERYRRAANVPRVLTGTGIGLSDVLQTVQRHGGTITVESVEGVSSLFTIRLPLAPPAPCAASAASGA